jgi:membrane-associated phospholipid phosphatase
MHEISVPPQPGSPDRAPQLLPMRALLIFLLIGAIFCVIGTLGFVWLARQVFANSSITTDNQIITWAHGFWGPTPDQVMLFFTTMGEPLVLGLFICLAALALWRHGRWIDAAGLVVAAVGSGIVNQLLKSFYHRTRPDLFAGLFHLTSYSFPSGHAMGSIVCYGMLAFVGARLLRRRVSKVALILVAGLLVLGVGMSRVYFGVHFPTDVLGGFIAGAIWLVIMIGIVRAAEWHAQRRRHTLPAGEQAPPEEPHHGR